MNKHYVVGQRSLIGSRGTMLPIASVFSPDGVCAICFARFLLKL